MTVTTQNGNPSADISKRAPCVYAHIRDLKTELERMAAAYKHDKSADLIARAVVLHDGHEGLPACTSIASDHARSHTVRIYMQRYATSTTVFQQRLFALGNTVGHSRETLAEIDPAVRAFISFVRQDAVGLRSVAACALLEAATTFNIQELSQRAVALGLLTQAQAPNESASQTLDLTILAEQEMREGGYALPDTQIRLTTNHIIRIMRHLWRQM